jgi:3-oxoacyl-[acyl-carrier protein] reductase
MKRRALVTGAASGLARGVAVALARSGDYDRIAITFRTTPAEDTLAEIRAAGVEARAHRIDFLDDEATIAAALDAAVRDGGPFDVLVHGVGPMVIKRFERSTSDDYREMFDGNIRSAVLAAHAVLPAMRERKFGRIVVFGMNGSSVTRPAKGFALHLAAKSALVAFARTLALEESQAGITVNVVEPGDIRDKTLTRAQALQRVAGNPRERPGTWEDVAGAVRFLVDPASDFITGAVLSVTGGLIDAAERNVPNP